MSKTLRMSGRPVRLALIGVATIMLGGCADTGGMGDPFSNPFAKTARVDHSATGTIAQPQQQSSNFFADAFRPFGDNNAQQSPSAPTIERARKQPRPSVAIDSQPLAAPGAQPHLALAAPSVSAPSVSTPAIKYAAAPALSSPLTRSGPGAVGGWTAEGGTPVVVAQGENADMIAQRFGVPSATLLSLNGYASRNQVQPGARLVIPVYHANGGVRSAAVEPRAVQAPRLEAPHLEAPKAPAKLARVEVAPKPDPAVILADKRAKIAAAKAVEATRQAAEAKAVATKLAAGKPNAVKTAQTKAAEAKLAEAKVAEAKAAAKLAQAQAQAAKVDSRQAKATVEAQKLALAKPAPVDKRQVVAALPTPASTSASVQPLSAKMEKPQAADPSPTASLPPAAASVASAGDSANPEFRWPARGRVIQAFGAGGNDGINIAVPEGTQVKAAEGGTVAYAGSELKGYGNLVLIRHPNGFVSAYANNGSINVKRGDTVKRGQTIALSGQTGNVASPQLHFELRKGSKPVDPSTYLAGL